MFSNVRYVCEPGTVLAKRPVNRRKGSIPKGKRLLLGARIHVDESNIVKGWVPARTVPNKAKFVEEGFVELDRTSPRQQLKVFYLDVGQGDATIIEAEGAIVIIDGGPNNIFRDKHIKPRLENLRRANAAVGRPQVQRLRINAVVVTHFDKDHYNGLTGVLKMKDIEVGAIYHNGLPRYDKRANKDLDLGTITGSNCQNKSISTDLTDLNSARQLLASGELLTKKGNLNYFAKFLQATVDAADGGRLGSMELLVRRDPDGKRKILREGDLRFEVLAPVTTKKTGLGRLPVYPDPLKVSASNRDPNPVRYKTINGNSIVLSLSYGDAKFLFGGDLNQPAQRYLNQRYPGLVPFKADVNKACHHGAPDFDIKYLKAVAPQATVFSSGDNGVYDHPFPDAIGAAAKHSKGQFPLIFSTELVRETGRAGIKLGNINARSNGKTIVMAQKKEKPSKRQEWHEFTLPFRGPFSGTYGCVRV